MWTKSELFPIYFPVGLKKALEDTYPFWWTKNTWKYLGIQFPLNLDIIKKANYDNLIRSIQIQLKSWNYLKLSWPDRFQLIKSFILPKCLFLFRTLPVLILPKEISCQQRLCTRFIWSYKTPRINLTTLKSPWDVGGLNFPDLGKYYKSSQIAAIFPILQTNQNGSWYILEENTLYKHTLMDTFWAEHKLRVSTPKTSLYLICSLKVWDKNRQQSASNTSPVSSFLNQHWFPPLDDEVEANSWRKVGICRLLDLLGKKKRKEKSVLSVQLQAKLSCINTYKFNTL